MGKHYIPQYYLKGFVNPSSSHIWVYEKGSQREFEANVSKIAHENGYFPDDVESYLANEIENPANPILDKIRQRQPITTQEKAILAAYIVVMLKRVPQGQIRFNQIAPSVVDSLFRRYDEQLVTLIKTKPEKAEILQRRRQEMADMWAQYQVQVPKDIWYNLLSSNTSSRVMVALQTMAWRFLTFDNPNQYFLTSDNPVFFFKSMGIGNAESEVTFPIARDIALWATWRTDLDEGYYQTTQVTVREINRRTVTIATRYVYYPLQASWVKTLANKKLRLNRLV